MSIEKLKEYIAKYGHNDKLLTDAILELAEQVEKESKGMTEIYDHHEARFRIIAEKIDEMQEQITELNNRLDVHKDSIKQNNNAICTILTKPEKSKWVWNQHKDVKINIENGNRFEYEQTTTGETNWFKVKFNHYYFEGCSSIDEAIAYIDSLTEGI